MKDAIADTSKTPYIKPTLMKHKPLRDITAQNGSIIEIEPPR